MAGGRLGRSEGGGLVPERSTCDQGVDVASDVAGGPFGDGCAGGAPVVPGDPGRAPPGRGGGSSPPGERARRARRARREREHREWQWRQWFGDLVPGDPPRAFWFPALSRVYHVRLLEMGRLTPEELHAIMEDLEGLSK